MKRLIIFGAPGSGKGTQTMMLSEYLKLKRISLGDILRQEVKNNTSLGVEVKNYMMKGILVPNELVSRVIEERIDNEERFILEGYPRNLSQAVNLERILKNKNNNNDIDVFLYLDIDKETILNRLSRRRVCRKCGINYHLDTMPSKKEGVCDVCGDILIQRDDDKPEVIAKRWGVFLKESEDVLHFYQERNKLRKINAGGNKEEIFNFIRNLLDSMEDREQRMSVKRYTHEGYKL